MVDIYLLYCYNEVTDKLWQLCVTPIPGPLQYITVIKKLLPPPPPLETTKLKWTMVTNKND